MRNIVLFAAVAAMTLSLTGAAQAQAPKQGGGKPNQRMVRMAEKLDLTEAQKTKIKAIGEKYQPKMKPIMEDQSLTKEQKGEKMKPIRKAMEEEVQAVLTPEQRKKLKTMQDEARAKMGAGRPGAGKTAGAKPGAKKP